MRLAAANSAAAGSANRHRRGELASRAITQTRQLAHHLVEGRIDVIGKLDLGDRLQTVHAHADRSSDDASLGDGSVEHTLLAIFALESVGTAKDAAEEADVLTHDDDARVPLQHDVHGGVDCLDHVHVRHGLQPSFATNRASRSRSWLSSDPSRARPAPIASSSSRWRTRCGGICA